METTFEIYLFKFFRWIFGGLCILSGTTFGIMFLIIFFGLPILGESFNYPAVLMLSLAGFLAFGMIAGLLDKLTKL